MKIVYFYQYFSTPKGSWGTRVYEFASEWVRKGHDVTIVSSIYSKSDLKATKLIEDQYFNGIHVKVLNITIDNKQTKLFRIFSFIKYSILSCWFALSLPADVVIVSSGPITVGLPGLIAKYIRKKKLIFEVRDLWPEGAIELGYIKNPIIKKLAYNFEKLCYKASSLIVTLSPGMRDYIEKLHNHKNVISVTNAANVNLFSIPIKFPNKIKDLKPFKYAIYTGNIGEVNNSYWLYNAAVDLKKRGRNDIKILLVGDGVQKIELQELAKKNNLDNFIIYNLMPKVKLVPFIQNAIVSLVPLKAIPILETSSPNKFFESIAAGVGIIQNTRGWMKDFLEEHKAGDTLDPNRPDLLATRLIELCDKKKENYAKSENLIKLAKKHFDTKVLAEKMISNIECI